MSIVTIVEECVALVDHSPEITFLHDVNNLARIQSDNAVFPAAILDEPITFTMILNQSGYLETVYQIVVSFGSKTEMDDTADNVNTVTEEMKGYADEFVRKLMAHANVSRVVSVEGVRFSNFLDVNLSGVLLTIQLVPKHLDEGC